MHIYMYINIDRLIAKERDRGGLKEREREKLSLNHSKFWKYQ